ncbi:uncharacterized protein bub1ba isoform 2-T2 [Odontesthes bonariensis]|uniref:uncharacterized protein bub1ba isoform X2 n=1 Tax=Odontesthes bonariensis TaxID=219752 RepID=UPI003F587AD4
MEERQPPNQSRDHLKTEACLQEEGGANQWSAYCKDELMRGGEELSFEELRAERSNQKKKKKKKMMEEKLTCLKDEEKQLCQELEKKKKYQNTTADTDSGLPPAAARPAGNTEASSDGLQDDVFLHSGESGLCVEIQFPPRPGAGVPSELSQNSNLDQTLNGHQSDASQELQTQLDSSTPTVSRKPASKNREKLSPIEETSVEAGSLNSPGGLSGGDVDPPEQHQLDQEQHQLDQDQHQLDQEQHQLDQDQHQLDQDQHQLDQEQHQLDQEQHQLDQEQHQLDQEQHQLDQDQHQLDQDQHQLDQEQEEAEHTASSIAGGVDPGHLDIRRRLLELCDVTSSPDLHSEPRPLPAVEEHSCLDLGAVVLYIFDRVVDGGSFSVFKGASENTFVFIKVDSCPVPWDFHQFNRLKKNSSAAEGLPLISCFLFEDGCITVYAPPPGYSLTELTECVSCELTAGFTAISLLRLISELHSCKLLHAALRPGVLSCCGIGFRVSNWVFPLDWSRSVDLDLQQDVTSVQQLPSAEAYVSLGLLEPTAPPHLVDLVGVAETVHLLLTRSRMVPVRDADGWTAERFSGDEPCDLHTSMWRRFFHSLLNAGGRSAPAVLTELTEQLASLFL